jgi:hypothetical protein
VPVLGWRVPTGPRSYEFLTLDRQRAQDKHDVRVQRHQRALPLCFVNQLAADETLPPPTNTHRACVRQASRIVAAAGVPPETVTQLMLVPLRRLLQLDQACLNRDASETKANPAEATDFFESLTGARKRQLVAAAPAILQRTRHALVAGGTSPRLIAQFFYDDDGDIFALAPGCPQPTGPVPDPICAGPIPDPDPACVELQCASWAPIRLRFSTPAAAQAVRARFGALRFRLELLPPISGFPLLPGM